MKEWDVRADVKGKELRRNQKKRSRTDGRSYCELLMWWSEVATITQRCFSGQPIDEKSLRWPRHLMKLICPLDRRRQKSSPLSCYAIPLKNSPCSQVYFTNNPNEDLNCACLVDNKYPAKIITDKTSDGVGLFFLIFLSTQIPLGLGGKKKKMKTSPEAREATEIDSHLRVTTGALAFSGAAERGQLPLSRLPWLLNCRIHPVTGVLMEDKREAQNV